MEGDGTEIKIPDVLCSPRVFLVEVNNSFQGMNIVPRLPGIMFNPEPFPFDKVAKFPVHHFAVQNLFHYPFLFTFYDLWRWWGIGATARDGVCWGWSQLDDIEDWMQSAHGRWEMEMICPITCSGDNWEMAEPSVREFTRWPGGLDITGIQVNHITRLILWGWCPFLIVVFCHVVFGLG